MENEDALPLTPHYVGSPPESDAAIPNVYQRFLEELDAMEISARDNAVQVVGFCIRAVKRAQMVYDGELPTVAARPEPLGGRPDIMTDILGGSDV
jgi:hypothetical protein